MQGMWGAAMRNQWYADNRDLIKWGVLLQLANRFEAKRILQVAYYRSSAFGSLVIDGQERDLQEDVVAHFRNLRTIEKISSKVQVTVFDFLFQDRKNYEDEVFALLAWKERCIVFLDPDTGLQPPDNGPKPRKPKHEHVLASEATAVWTRMKPLDVLAFYQHQTNRNGQPWIKPKQCQLAKAIGVQVQEVKTAQASANPHSKQTVRLPQDVVIFYIQKPAATK